MNTESMYKLVRLGQLRAEYQKVMAQPTVGSNVRAKADALSSIKDQIKILVAETNG